WRGFPLADLIRRVEPTSRAKYVEFITLHDPQQMPMQRQPVLDWPYNEGLRMDEALHPLTLLVTGLYGKDLPNQNGAPLRLVVPWKYGFKSIKSIVKIRFVEEQPRTTWMNAAPREYGFYANVNPEVDHPRWSQKRQRRIGEFRRREAVLFNGYAGPGRAPVRRHGPAQVLLGPGRGHHSAPPRYPGEGGGGRAVWYARRAGAAASSGGRRGRRGGTGRWGGGEGCGYAGARG